METALDQSLTFHNVLPEKWQTLKLSTLIGLDNHLHDDLFLAEGANLCLHLSHCIVSLVLAQLVHCHTAST